MINTINSDLIRGNIDTIILKALFDGDRYGYDIIKEIEQKSNGQYKLKQPTLYSCLKRLEVQNFIRSYWGAKTSGGRRKYYTLTEMGRELFIKSQSEWEYSRSVIDKLISDKEYALAVYSEIETGAEDIDSEENFDALFDKSEEDFEEDDAVLNAAQTAAPYPDPAFLEPIKYDDAPDGNSGNDAYTQNNSAAEFEQYIPVAETAAAQDTQVFENYKDTSQIINELFSSETSDTSYSDKLLNERYVKEKERPYRQDPGNYFKDFTDDYSDLISEKTEGDPLPESNDYTYEPATENAAFAARQNQDVKPEPEETAKETENQFMGYNNNAFFVPKNDDQRILEREYKGLLGRLLVNQDLSLNDSGYEQPQQKNVVYEEEVKSAAEIARETALNQNLNKIQETARQTTGENLKTRIHDNRADAVFRKKYHYYSNKIMLTQYAVLFAIMLAMIVATFIVSFVWLKVYKSSDLAIYIGAVLLALAFPVVAAVVNFKNPGKKKRCEYDFKNNLIFRTLVCICFLIITYCLNLYLGMPFSLSADYITTLMLPALFSLCVPFSAVIFYLLYSSGRYNQK